MDQHKPSTGPTRLRRTAPSLAEAPLLPPGSRYLITGGGTGGHVYPAIAIADEIRRRDPSAQFLYVGVKGKSEATIVPKRGYPLTFVRSEGWPGARQPVALARFTLKITLGVLKSIFILLTFRPRLIVGTGGYVSAPIMFAAILLRRLRLFHGRTFIHEANTFPGKLNRVVGSLVDKVGVSFPESLKYFPRTGSYVGYPVRREVGQVNQEEARARLGIPPGRKVVFAFGGSQGARTINRAMVEALPILRERGDLFIIHGTGAYKGGGYDAVGDTEARLAALKTPLEADFYLRKDYIHDIEQVYAVADLVVCRGGAGTLTEIAARGLPALIIPKANLPGDHQVKNARAMANAGAGQVLYERVALTEGGIQERVDGVALAKAISDLIDAPELRQSIGKGATAYYRADALDRIAETLGMLMDPSRKSQLPPAPEPPQPSGPDLEALGPVALLSYLEGRERRKEGPLPASDVEYLQYRTDDYLASSSWQVRNRGVKLVGLLHYQERLPHLLFMLKEQRPAPLSQRLMGGDFEQVGFIRRNIFEAIRRLNHVDTAVADVIEIGLEDNYFEVRTQAAMTAAHFADRLGSDQTAIASQLRRRLDDRSFEVVIAAIQALGRISTDGALVENLRMFLFNKNWKVRQAVVEALEVLLERGVVQPGQVSSYLSDMLITSNGFQPHFPLKAGMQRLGRRLHQAPPAVTGLSLSPEDDA